MGVMREAAVWTKVDEHPAAAPLRALVMATDSRARAVSESFKGKISVDIRDSVPDWSPFEPPKAPEGAPTWCE
jgi:hypothetical protein